MLPIIFLIIFSGRYFWGHKLEQNYWWSTYLIELIFIISVLIFYSKDIKKFLKWNSSFIKKAIIFLLFGGLSRFFIYLGGWSIPWDLNDPLTIFILLIIAPLLEESLYRGAIWILLSKMINGPKKILGLTSGLFSLSHLYPIWFVDKRFAPMIYTQTIYTLILGLGCGQALLKHKSFGLSVLRHFMFNVGFYFLSRML
jgi:membrane protease YdiL (CAAX protease family)